MYDAMTVQGPTLARAQYQLWMSVCIDRNLPAKIVSLAPLFKPLFLRGQWRCALRRAPEMRRVFERIGQRQQLRLAPRLAEDVHADGHAKRGGTGRRGEPGRDRDRREAGHRCQDAVAVGLVEFGQRYHEPLLQRIDDGIKVVVVHHLLNKGAGLDVAVEPDLVVRLGQAVLEGDGGFQETLEGRG